MRNSFAEKQTGKSRSPFARAIDKTPSAPFDWWLFTIMLVILAVGLVMVLSASGIVAERVNGDKYYFFKRQLLFALAGGAALWAAALLPRQWLYRLQYPALFLSLLLLLITLSPFAPAINGAKRWIPLGPVSIQPMEFAKIALALYLAYFMSTKQALVKTFSRGVIPPFAVTGLFCCLLLAQPDFGGAAVLAMILFFMCLVGGTRFIYLFMSIAMAGAGG
ncbi:FtsW/RodA/SpoVE family cell cycle protein, partial [uncultured Desulfovibrio sp.]|uniref:FtsW/RodA/SpoVE family cell cycle protein n=1 Tax=uncultured Desulfovibrio sp. TaxID=167968 RepID=UPI00267019B4